MANWNLIEIGVAVVVIGGAMGTLATILLKNTFATKLELKNHKEECQEAFCKKIDNLTKDVKDMGAIVTKDSKTIAVALTRIADKLDIAIDVP